MSQPTAAILDINMLQRLGVAIASEGTVESDLPPVLDCARELGGRLLIKYIRADAERHYSRFSGVTEFPGPHWLTPTPLNSEEVESALNLPPLSDEEIVAEIQAARQDRAARRA